MRNVNLDIFPKLYTRIHHDNNGHTVYTAMLNIALSEQAYATYRAFFNSVAMAYAPMMYGIYVAIRIESTES